MVEFSYFLETEHHLLELCQMNRKDLPHLNLVRLLASPGFPKTDYRTVGSHGHSLSAHVLVADLTGAGRLSTDQTQILDIRPELVFVRLLGQLLRIRVIITQRDSYYRCMKLYMLNCIIMYCIIMHIFQYYPTDGVLFLPFQKHMRGYG